MLEPDFSTSPPQLVGRLFASHLVGPARFMTRPEPRASASLRGAAERERTVTAAERLGIFLEFASLARSRPPPNRQRVTEQADRSV
jgi:hypothetical protein